MELIFLSHFAPAASIIKTSNKSKFFFYETNDSLFILCDTNKAGLITEKIKKAIKLKDNFAGKEVFFINMFNNKEDMKNLSEEMAWGTYAWFKNSPRNYIHFDNAPSKLMIENRSFTK